MGIGTFARIRRLSDPTAGAASVYLVMPPYDACRAFASCADRDLPLGTVAVARGSGALAMLGALTLVSQRWPWVVPALVTTPPETNLQYSLDLVSDLRYRLVLLGWHPGELDAAPVVAAVRRRSFPPAMELARFVARRLGDARVLSVLAGQFAVALEGANGVVEPSSATLSRFFSRHGAFTARDWRSLAVLAKELWARSSGRPGPGGLVTTRTVDANARRFLGASAPKACCLLGWECVFEQALRLNGYRVRPLNTLQ